MKQLLQSTPSVKTILVLLSFLAVAVSSSAQIDPGGFYTQKLISAYPLLGGGLTHDDVSINCDMINSQAIPSAQGWPVSAVAWDEGTGSNGGFVYFEDEYTLQGITLQINGVRPDVILGDDMSSGGTTYRAAVAYIAFPSLTPQIDYYTLSNIGTIFFTATLTSTATFGVGTPINVNQTEGFIHLDMWSGNTYLGGLPEMNDFICTWSEGGTIYYITDNITSPSPAPPPQYLLQGYDPDVAAYTDHTTGNRYASFVYRLPGQLYQLELDMGSLAISSGPTALVVPNVTDYWFPRIEAMSQYVPGTAKWEIAAIAYNPMSSGCNHFQCYGFNDLTPPNCLSCGYFCDYDVKAPTVAAGTGTPYGDNIGNIIYTPGFSPWQERNIYIRAIDAFTGNPVNTIYYRVNNKPLATPPIYNLADLGKGFATSSSSNSGNCTFSAWFDGDKGIWVKRGDNSLQLKPTAIVTVNTMNSKEVYPNPTSDELFVSIEGSYKIVDMLGKVVQYGMVSSREKPIDLQQMPQGIYMLQLQGKEGVKVFKFTKK